MTNSTKAAPMGAVNYASAEVPVLYRCGGCGASGVKLWREYQTFLENQSLRCAACACVEQTRDGKKYSVEQTASGGVRVTTSYDEMLQPALFKVFSGRDAGGDQIGWRIPAVPTEDGSTFWGYSSVPDGGVAWWKRLPLQVAP